MSRPRLYIVLVYGGRNYRGKAELFAKLAPISQKHPNLCILQGGATGADRLAREFASSRGVMCLECPAWWDFYGNSAGPTRNFWMADVEPDMAVECPGGAGTKSMREILQARKVLIERVAG